MQEQIGRQIRQIAQFIPTTRYATLVALCAPMWLVAGTTAGNSAIAIMVVLLLFILVFDAAHLPAQDKITLTRTVSPVMGLREPETGEYHLLSRVSRKLYGRLVHGIPSAIDATFPNTAFSLPANQSVTHRFTIQGRNRGKHVLGKVALKVRTSLGLIDRILIYDLSDTISVIPSLAEGHRYRLAAVQKQMRTAGERALRQKGQGTAFANLREYTIGDDPRHLDWKASARRNRLITRQYTIEQGQNVLIAIDAGRMMAQIAGDRPRLEYALASALTLADVALAAGDRVGLLLFNELVRNYIPPARGSGTLVQIRDALTSITATLAEPDYAAAFRTLAERHRRRSLVVLFTDVIDLRSSRAVVANTARTAIRHLPLIVALRNEQLTQASIPPIDGKNDATYQSIAAEELLSARDEVLQNMRQSGASIIDTPPRAMTATLINRYLDIKGRALL